MRPDSPVTRTWKRLPLALAAVVCLCCLGLVMAVSITGFNGSLTKACSA